MRHRRIFPVFFGCAVFAAVLGVFAWLFPHAILTPVAQFLVVCETPQPSDAIVILLGGDAPDRVFKAADLFRHSLAPRIVFGSGFVDQTFMKDAPPGFVWLAPSLRFETALESLGIPKEEIALIDTSSAFDTSGELSAIAAYARSHHWSRLVLVSSATHSRRVGIIWHRIAPDLPVFVCGAEDPELSTWWKSSRAIRSMGYEYGALIKEAFRQVAQRPS